MMTDGYIELFTLFISMLINITVVMYNMYSSIPF